MSRGQRRGGIGLLLLASQIMSIGTDRIPPVTLFTVILNTVIYMRLWPGLPSVDAACSSNSLVFNSKQWSRLLMSSFYHLDDMHLYYNMISFIWKGITLERQLGKRKFVILLLVFSLATQFTMLGLNKFFAVIFFNKYYLRTCAAGFSAVIFALKVLTTASSNSREQIMGLPIVVPSRYACWIELVLIQILVPNASFTGHLAGILVGLLYIYGPLKWLVKALSKLSKGYHQPSAVQPQRNTLDEEDEDLQRAIRESLRDQHHPTSQPPAYGWHVPPDTRTPYPNHPPDTRTTYPNHAPDTRTTYPNHAHTVNDDSPPPYPTSNRNNIYPDLSEQTRSVPSAPVDPTPYYNTRSHSSGPQTYRHNPDLPYPPVDEWESNEPPYPADDNILPSPGPANDNPDELRRARLRHFNKT